MNDPKQIYLGEIDGERCWCEDDDPGGTGEPWIRYVRADIVDQLDQRAAHAQAEAAKLERERDELRQTVADVLWMARRYAHGRHTYAPSVVEGSYRRLGRLSGDPDTTLDCTLDGDCLCDSCLIARLDTQTGDDDA